MFLLQQSCLLLVVWVSISMGLWLHGQREDIEGSFSPRGAVMKPTHGLLLGAGITTATDFASQCQNFNISVPNVHVNVLEFVANGTNITTLDADPTCSPLSQVVYGGDICRVALYVTTSPSSGIHMEAWLPADWNGRFLSAGNGGLGGCIAFDDIAYANFYGFAAVGANNGHNGSSGLPLLNAPEVVEDFAYRSVHTGVVVGKELTQSFYGSNISYSYYLGCSTGGRQGLKEAQDFPEDFDGIVAGAPAFDFNNLNTWGQYLSSTAGFDPSSPDFIPQALWTVINDEVIRQCDGLDGALDGIIEDTDLCTPKLETLVCSQSQANTSACLNPGQYTRAVKLFQPFYAGPGDLLYPRLQPSAHAGNPYFSGTPFTYSADWAKYVVYNDADLDVASLGLQLYLDARALDPYNISTWSGDLSAFRARGAKLLTYHGLSDAIISSDNSARYYGHLSSTMNLRPAELDDFYRYFRIGGMGHCFGQAGAWDIGQKLNSRPPGVSGPGNNVLEAIVAWVERGEAPEELEGVKWTGRNGGGQEEFRRRHCRWPRRNVYKGVGNGTDENGWECVL